MAARLLAPWPPSASESVTCTQESGPRETKPAGARGTQHPPAQNTQTQVAGTVTHEGHLMSKTGRCEDRETVRTGDSVCAARSLDPLPAAPRRGARGHAAASRSHHRAGRTLLTAAGQHGPAAGTRPLPGAQHSGGAARGLPHLAPLRGPRLWPPPRPPVRRRECRWRLWQRGSPTQEIGPGPVTLSSVLSSSSLAPSAFLEISCPRLRGVL